MFPELAQKAKVPQYNNVAFKWTNVQKATWNVTARKVHSKKDFIVDVVVVALFVSSQKGSIAKRWTKGPFFAAFNEEEEITRGITFSTRLEISAAAFWLALLHFFSPSECVCGVVCTYEKCVGRDREWARRRSPRDVTNASQAHGLTAVSKLGFLAFRDTNWMRFYGFGLEIWKRNLILISQLFINHIIIVRWWRTRKA